MKTESHRINVGSYGVAEVRIHILRETMFDVAQIATKPEDSAKFFRDVITKADWFDADKECCVVLFLNNRNRITGWNLISLGTVNSTLVHPREVLRAAIVGSSVSFVLIHNHPSGDPLPSSADMRVTHTIREAAKACEITFLDHLIVGQPACDPLGVGHYSFRHAGIL
jgi:DNA repair protein RadC